MTFSIKESFFLYFIIFFVFFVFIFMFLFLCFLKTVQNNKQKLACWKNIAFYHILLYYFCAFWDIECLHFKTCKILKSSIRENHQFFLLVCFFSFFQRFFKLHDYFGNILSIHNFTTLALKKAWHLKESFFWYFIIFLFFCFYFYIVFFLKTVHNNKKKSSLLQEHNMFFIVSLFF